MDSAGDTERLMVFLCAQRYSGLILRAIAWYLFRICGYAVVVEVGLVLSSFSPSIFMTTTTPFEILVIFGIFNGLRVEGIFRVL